MIAEGRTKHTGCALQERKIRLFSGFRRLDEGGRAFVEALTQKLGEIPHIADRAPGAGDSLREKPPRMGR